MALIFLESEMTSPEALASRLGAERRRRQKPCKLSFFQDPFPVGTRLINHKEHKDHKRKDLPELRSGQ